LANTASIGAGFYMLNHGIMDRAISRRTVPSGQKDEMGWRWTHVAKLAPLKLSPQRASQHINGTAVLYARGYLRASRRDCDGLQPLSLLHYNAMLVTLHGRQPVTTEFRGFMKWTRSQIADLAS